MLRPLFAAFLWLWLPTSVAAQPLSQAKPWLGVAIDQGKVGVLVKQTLADTPAEKAGIKAGDEITAVEQVQVKTPQELIKAVLTFGVGQTVTVHYLRDGKKETRSLQLLARPEQLELARKKLLDQAAPPFNLPVIHGAASGDISKAQGKVVLVEFWATWCPACVASHPRLSAVAAKKEIVVLAISDEDAATLKPYAAKEKPHFTILSDEKQESHGKWMVSAIPMIGVIDQKGIVRHVALGGGAYLEEAIRIAEELAKKPAL